MLKLSWSAESCAIFIMLFSINNIIYKPALTVAVIVAVSVLLWRYHKQRILTLPTSSIYKLIYLSALIFSVGMLLSGLFSPTPFSSLRRGVEYTYWLVPFFLIGMLYKNENSLKAAWMGILASILFMVSYGVYKQPEVIHEITRMQSFYPNPNTLAAILILLLPFSILGGAIYKKNKLLLGMAILTSGIGLWALAVAQSRGALAGLLAGFILWALLQIKQRPKNAVISFLVVFLLIGITAFSSPTLMKRTYNTGNMGDHQRVLMWNAAVDMWKDHAFFGVGLGNFNRIYKNEYILPGAREPFVVTPHNTTLYYLCETGLVGGAAYIALLGLQLTFFWRYLKKQPDNLWLQAMLIAWIAIHVHGLVDVLMVVQPINRLYWSLIGITCASVCFKGMPAQTRNGIK